MEIIVGKTAGFCGGVRNSIEKSLDALNRYNAPVYCLGELVHNQHVVDELSSKGLVFIDSLDGLSDCTVILRAHGVTKETYNQAEINNINLIDLTCPNVLRIHNKVSKYADDDFYVVLIAQKDHPETIGTKSFCGDKSFVVENVEDINNLLEAINLSNVSKVAVTAQTTYSVKDFDTICNILKDKIVDKELVIDNTICNATSSRQKETADIAKNVDAMVIIGGKKSSNTKKLYEVAKALCEKTFVIESSIELDLKELEGCKKLGVMAGASTPKDSIDEVISLLKGGNYGKETN